GDAGRTRAIADEARGFDVTIRKVERVEQAGGGDDRGAVLVIMKNRDVEQFTQALLDNEAFRGLDVLKIDAAPGLAEKLDAFDDFIGVFARNFKIDRVDIGK